MASDRDDDTHWWPLEAVEALISPEEAKLLQVEYGEASSQAVMEAYAILRAIDKWGHDWAGRGIMIRSDSTVALAMMQKLSSRHPTLNFIAAEISLRLEKFEVQRLVHQHLRGYLNEEADWLSRLAERKDKPKPAGLTGVPLKRGMPWNVAERFHFPPPGQELPPGAVRLTPGDGVFERSSKFCLEKKTKGNVLAFLACFGTVFVLKLGKRFLFKGCNAETPLLKAVRDLNQCRRSHHEFSGGGVLGTKPNGAHSN